MTVEAMAAAAPIPATADVPDDVAAMLRPDAGVYIRSEARPTRGLTTEPVPGAPGLWRVLDVSDDERVLTRLPGGEQTALERPRRGPRADTSVGTDGCVHPWLDQVFLPRLVPFRTRHEPTRTFLEPRTRDQSDTLDAGSAPHLAFPWQTFGKVFSSGGPSGGEGGTGVLVGPNLVLTSSHVAPWGASSWTMEFIPGLDGTFPGPFGSSFVSQFHGVRTEPEVSGLHYVICRLFTPLGNALGWMGAQYWGNEDEYYRRRFTSSGYPDSFNLRPAVEFDIGVVDLDGDGDGLEIELPIGHPFGPGWSGGPLWCFDGGQAKVVGIHSGSEKDGLDPRRHVEAGGKHMVDLVKFGLANWPV